MFPGAVADTGPSTHHRWTRPGVWQGKAGEGASERDKDHRWTRPGQGGKAAGTGPAVSEGHGYPLVHTEHTAQSKCRMGEILLHADKILHVLAKEITCYILLGINANYQCSLMLTNSMHTTCKQTALHILPPRCNHDLQ